MDPQTAARLLQVAEHEVSEVRLRAGRWEARHHDMASHEETWRVLPGQPDDDPEGPGVDVDGDGVPEGNAAQILDWVGADTNRAGAALQAEHGRDKPRTTLIAALERLAG